MKWQSTKEFLEPSWRKIILTFLVVLFWQLIIWLTVPATTVTLFWKVSVESSILSFLKLLYYYPFACLLDYSYTLMKKRRLMRFLHTGKGMLLVFSMILFINPFSWWIILSSLYGLLLKSESLSFCGVLIGEVIPESPADHVGMEPSQVIVEMDKILISDVVQFREILLRKKPSDFMEVRTLDGQSFNLTLEKSTIYPNQPFMGIANLANFRCSSSYRR